MKRVILTSAFAALFFGSLTAFINSVAWTHVRYRYEPPLSREEMRQWDQGSVAHLQAELAKRQVPYTKSEWLADSIRARFFWFDLAKKSLVPILCMFVACICVGGLISREPRAATLPNQTQPNA
jgi:hypothetical protein